MIRSNLAALLLTGAAAWAQPVETVRVESAALRGNVQVTGELRPWQTVDIRARLSGFVERVLVDRGTLVQQGQLLAVLSAPELDAQIAEAKAKVTAAEAQVAEAQAKQASAEAIASRLLEASSTPGAISRLELETAEKATEAARGHVNAAIASRTAALAAVTSLEKLRDYLRIRAPFSGVVTERLAHPGALAEPSGEPLLRIDHISRLRLVAAVPEARYSAVSAGSRIPFRVPAYPNETFTGRVARIPRSLDPKTRTMPVEIDIANPRARLAPGMYAEAEWPVGGSSLVVPATSIATTTERVFVVRVRNSRAEWVDVKRGSRQGDLIAVTGDLKVGDVILRRGTDEIREGATVQVTKP